MGQNREVGPLAVPERSAGAQAFSENTRENVPKLPDRYCRRTWLGFTYELSQGRRSSLPGAWHSHGRDTSGRDKVTEFGGLPQRDTGFHQVFR